MINRNLKTYILLSLFIIGIGTASRADGNLPLVDQKLIHFGFLLGINNMDFNVTVKDSAKNSPSKDRVQVSTLQPGFTVGIISDLRLNRYLNLRFTPTLYFGERLLNYSFKGGITGKDSTVHISSIPISFPIYLKYSAERKGNYRPYLIWGGGVSFDLATNPSGDNPVLLKPVNVYTEFGVGCDIYFSFFKLAPELKYSIGLNDIFLPISARTSSVNPSNQRFSNVLDKLTSKMFTLCFNFE